MEHRQSYGNDGKGWGWT